MSESCSESSCSTCGVEGCSSRKAEDFRAPANAKSHIKHVIGIVSGKGGVGKSLVTSEIAVLLRKKGYKVGILDADITGPSIPKAFGVGQRAFSNSDGIIPVETEKGTKMMSVNLLLENSTDPVIWRGPVIAGVVKQFWHDVVWGDVDYMFIDMPPGTGDVPLTVFQSLPVDGIIIVTSPQELVSMIVEKSVNMAEMMNVPVLGIVENMSYFECPNCNEKHYIYGESHIEEVAARHNIDLIAKIPVDQALAKACDNGKIEDYTGNWLDAVSEKI